MPSNIESKEIVDQYMCLEKKQPQQFKKLGLFSFTFCFLEPLECELFLCCGQLCVFALICFSDSLFLPTTPTPPNPTNTTKHHQHHHPPPIHTYPPVCALRVWLGYGHGFGYGFGLVWPWLWFWFWFWL